MGLRHSPKIVTDGLVLCLDAGNAKSYPGSGTTWYDLSGNGNDGTLNNGPTFSGDNGGVILFDGVNDYAEVLTPYYEYGKEITVSAFCKFTDFEYILSQSKKNIDNMQSNVWLWHKATNGFAWYVNDSGAWRVTGYVGLSTNTWYYITTTSSDSNIKIYINTNIVAQGLGISSQIQNVSDSGIGTNDYRYSSSRTPMNGIISDIKIYNRELNSLEIRQNYQALRGRYNI